MEPTITPALLASTGIDIPDDQVEALLDHMNEQLEERIGETIVATLSDTQLEQLATLQETASDAEVHAWIQTNVTDLADIIQDEVDILLGEAVQLRDSFNSN